MGHVVTINRKKQFDSEISETVKTITRVTIDNMTEDVETKIIPRNKRLLTYAEFLLEFYKKYNLQCRVNNKEVSAVLRKYRLVVFVDDSKDYVFTLGKNKGIIAKAAFKRLRKDTPVKCLPVLVDLEKAIPAILSKSNNITVNSGWISKLGTQLQNALLQGDSVDENPDWKKFVKTKGAELKNVQFKLIDDEYSNGYILISLSSRGFIFTNSSIGPERFMRIVETIMEYIDTPEIISYEGSEEEEEDNDFEELESFTV